MSITEKISQFVVDSSVEKMPPEAVKIAKQAIMDCLGCMLLGAVQPIGEIISEFVIEAAAKPIATIVGQGKKTVPHLAALANGVMAHAEDYDDMCLAIYGHPSPPLLPAILALSEQYKVSGKKVIEAYITGFEAGASLGQALNSGHYNRGWHGTATLGTIEAVAASAKLLKLDMNQTRMALGIASSEVSGLRQNFGTMTKPFHAGNAAKNGVIAAQLAAKGFTADPNIIEAPLGFGYMFQGDKPPDWEKVASLGKTFEITTSGIAFKPYPSCGETHAGIEIILDLLQKYHFSAEDVTGIECIFNETMNSVMLHTSPQKGLEGKFSAEYCIARALLDGKVGLQDFTDEKINQPQVRRLMEKVKRKIDPAMAMIASTINVKLKDGRQLSQHTETPKGWPQNPLTQEELVAKYKDCAQFVLSPGDIARSAELLENLEDIKDITELMNILGKSSVCQV
jgi:2-methylcitrate dehydratase PrpD